MYLTGRAPPPQRSAQTIRQKWLATAPAGRCAAVDPESHLGNGKGGVVSAARARHASPRFERPATPPRRARLLPRMIAHRRPSRAPAAAAQQTERPGTRGWVDGARRQRPLRRFSVQNKLCHGRLEQRCVTSPA
jgi:hypothetical protein